MKAFFAALHATEKHTFYWLFYCKITDYFISSFFLSKIKQTIKKGE